MSNDTKDYGLHRHRDTKPEKTPHTVLDVWLFLNELSKVTIDGERLFPDATTCKDTLFRAMSIADQDLAMAAMGPHDHMLALRIQREQALALSSH